MLLLLSSAAFSQNIIQKKEDVSKLLCKTWNADHATLNGLNVEQMGPMKSLKYAFKTDGTYLLNDKNPGKWKYDTKKKCIELYQDNALKSTITTLRSKKIVMILNPAKGAPKGAGKLEIFFKPKV